jgi:transposase
MARLCEAFGISRKTGYKLRARYKDGGLVGLTNRGRRPCRHANPLPMGLEKWVVRSKREYPDWEP